VGNVCDTFVPVTVGVAYPKSQVYVLPAVTLSIENEAD
jgi:hypothetical protein